MSTMRANVMCGICGHALGNAGFMQHECNFTAPPPRQSGVYDLLVDAERIAMENFVFGVSPDRKYDPVFAKRPADQEPSDPPGAGQS